MTTDPVDLRLYPLHAESYVQDMPDTTRPTTITRLSVCVELTIDPTREEAVRWAVERAAERAAQDSGAQVLRAIATSDPI